MAKKRKKNKARGSKSLFSFGFSKGKKSRTYRRKKRPVGAGLRTTGMILVIILVLVGIAFGLTYLDEYVENLSPVMSKYGPVRLLDKPGWFNNELCEMIETAIGDSEIALDVDAAEAVAGSLESVEWIYDVKTQTTNNCVEVSAKYRKPIALIKRSGKTFYLAWSRREEMPGNWDIIVLKYLPISDLAIVEIKGHSLRRTPAAGTILNDDDITAALKILKSLENMDSMVAGRRLLYEIDSIDVKNYGGKRDSDESHIVLNALDGTQVKWGAGLGESERYLEAIDKEKLAGLYQVYEQNGGTILGILKFIELRDPQRLVPRPGSE